MEKKWFALIVILLILGAALGYKVSDSTGIQPGYFEKQEAPAYGVSAEKAIGSDLGKKFEEHFKDLYKEE
jgi:hypothetical protein